MKNFKLSKYQIANLFEPDNIRSGESTETLKNWGKIEGLEQLLHTNFKKGLEKNYKEHKSRIEAYDDNQPVQKPPKNIWQLVSKILTKTVENFQDETLRILCFFVVFSLILGFFIDGTVDKWVEKISILIAVVIIIFVAAISNYIKEQQFQKFQRSNNKATARDIYVYRGGDRVKITVCELLVGDIAQISLGQILPVDGVLIVGNDISVDESSMTGQASEIKKRVPVTYDKQERADPFLISESRIMSGSGLMVVAAVGKNSYHGKLKMKIQCCQDETFLQVKLSDFADKTGRLGILFAIATFFVLFVHYIYDCFNAPNFIDSFLTLKTLHEVIENFIITIIIAIIAVPEGLPLSVTTALAYSIQKMKEQNNLVKYFQAVENIGAADNICTDKTGTLTKNLMTVTKMFIQESIHENFTKEMVSKNTGRIFSLGVCNNSNANPKFVAEQGQRLRIQQKGNKTECALLEVAYRLGFDYEKFRNKDRIKHFFPFSSERKKMATVYEDEIGKLFLFVKGPPDFMIPSCTHFINRYGEVTQINQEYINKLDNIIQEFAAASLRTLFLCYKLIKSIPEDWSQIESDLIIITIAGMKDPLREGIQEAVTQCNEGGVTVRMVTGDNKTTAISIAKEANILPSNWQPSEGDYTVMEGRQFRESVGGLVFEETQNSSFETVGNLENFKLIRDQLRVLARSTPCDKYLLTVGLKELGHVVAMTGDGTGDAPSLKRADVGFAMGIAGTEVSKEASGIILMDDNFCSIITAIKWGRNIFDSIKKIVQFQLTVNFVALVMIFIGAAIFGESPIKPIQILWISQIMDILASLALATEHPSSETLRSKPYSKKEGLITNQMWKFIISQGVYQIIVLGVILFKGPEIFDIPSSIGAKQWSKQTGKHFTIFFNVFVFLQIFNEINARKLNNDQYNVFKKIFNNKIFLVVIVSTIIIQLIIVEYGGRYFKTVELSFKENLICIALGSTSLISCLAFKSILPQNWMIYLQDIRFGSFKLLWTQINEQEQEQ